MLSQLGDKLASYLVVATAVSVCTLVDSVVFAIFVSAYFVSCQFKRLPPGEENEKSPKSDK